MSEFLRSSGAQISRAARATFDAWRDAERLELAAEHAPSEPRANRSFGNENPNRRDTQGFVNLSRRAHRTVHLREIADEAESAVRIGSVNRFKS